MSLDFLGAAAVAVALVFVGHLLGTLRIRLFGALGHLGVLLFFVHTAFVLMLSMERLGLGARQLYRTFAIRRFFRIYPLSTLAVLAAVCFQTPPVPWSGRYIWKGWLSSNERKVRPPYSRVQHHVDIGSRIDRFIAPLLALIPVTVVDIRPILSTVEGLSFIQADCTELSIFQDGSLESVPSLPAAEHFGLGRYGDPIDPDAPFRFMVSLARVLRPGGRLFFSVPVGRERGFYMWPHTFAATFTAKRLILCAATPS